MRNTLLPLLIIILFACESKKETTETVNASIIPVLEKTVEKAEQYKKLPDFTQYTDVNEKKKAFFDFLRPMVEEENNRIRNERERLKSLYITYKKDGSLSDDDQKWLSAKAETMRIKTFDISKEADRVTLLRRVDVVPSSLFLAQAANESSWGTSRFAKQANNLFGQWCFTPGCGVVPSQRAEGEVHEVQKFNTVNDAVNSYVRNINSHNAYKELRVLRKDLRDDGKKPDGITLAAGLIKYSARGDEYVKEIRSMIDYNKLEENN